MASALSLTLLPEAIGQGDIAVYGMWPKTAPDVHVSLVVQRIGRPDTLDELTRRLLREVAELSRYKSAFPYPSIRVVPIASLQKRLCGGPCGLRAAYVPGEGVLLDESLRPLSNQLDQSILFHELVHYVQDSSASYVALDDCQRWRVREAEAYSLQNRFLVEVGAHVRVYDPGVPCVSSPRRTVQTFGEPR